MELKKLIIGSVVVSPPLILAPMAGITNGPFRRVCRLGGAGSSSTEMISAKALKHGDRRTREMAHFAREEHPVAAQIFGRDPEEMALAAAFLEDRGADIIDINMGCPVKKVLKSGSGVQLMREPDRASAIVSRVVRSISVPVTVKIRLGWTDDESNYIRLGKILQDEGASAVTLHPRTRTQGFSGRARWECIGHLKESLTIPVLGSGDVVDAGGVKEMFRITGCDAVMIGRGALGKPWIFRQISSDLEWTGETVDTAWCRDLMAIHISLLLEAFPGRRSVGQLRKHLAWYTKGYPNGSSFRREVNRIDDPGEIVKMAEAFLGLEGKSLSIQ